MNLAFDHPWALWLALAAALPLWRSLHLPSHWPRLASTMQDPASDTLNLILRTLAALAIIALALSVAGPYRPGGEIARIGTGAHLVLLIDRSSSMNGGFARHSSEADAESKAAAAKRLLQGFADSRPHDRIGVVGFSTMPMLVTPLTNRPQAVQAAIGAIDRPGLAYTDVGRGLAMALALFGNDADAATSRVVMLISDGAALVDRKVQEQLRADVAERPVQIYWLFLRSEGSPGIYDVPEDSRLDTPQSMPERHLDLFFKSLNVPYRAFEATSAEDVARAIEEVGREQQKPIRYMEPLPRVELHRWTLALACLSLVALIAAKVLEVQVRPQEVAA